MSDPTHQPLDWSAYDVPRIWDAVRRENDFLAWEQAKGFKHLAQLLDEQRDRLTELRETVTAAWDPATHPAAATYVALLGDLTRSLEQDAIAHRSTSRALDAILTTLKAAKERISLLKRQWDRVTTDSIPQWWDTRAGDLNRRARHVIRQAEEAIADHMRRMLVAPAYECEGSYVETTVPEQEQRPSRKIVPPPPVPGYDPVPAVPGSPISLLPVPPGNPHAPGGGAYVLPGPGIGSGGWIYPMPDPDRPSEEGKPRRARHLIWDVKQGVTPVVGEPEGAETVPDDGFLDWFSELSMPWTAQP